MHRRLAIAAVVLMDYHSRCLGDNIVPRVLLEATHEKALKYVKLEDLEQFKATEEDKNGTSEFVTVNEISIIIEILLKFNWAGQEGEI